MCDSLNYALGRCVRVASVGGDNSDGPCFFGQLVQLDTD